MIAKRFIEWLALCARVPGRHLSDHAKLAGDQCAVGVSKGAKGGKTEIPGWEKPASGAHAPRAGWQARCICESAAEITVLPLQRRRPETRRHGRVRTLSFHKRRSTMKYEENARKIEKIIAAAWIDEGFKQRLLSDPAASLKEQGVEIPPRRRSSNSGGHRQCATSGAADEALKQRIVGRRVSRGLRRLLRGTAHEGLTKVMRR
jgi:hypothetical protein